MDNQTITANILERMVAVGYSQLDLAAEIGIPGSGLSRRLSGQRQWLPGELERCAEVLEITIEQLHAAGEK